MIFKFAQQLYADIPMKSKSVLPDEGFEPRPVEQAIKHELEDIVREMTSPETEPSRLIILEAFLPKYEALRDRFK